MKLHLPNKLRAAVIAAVAAVGITLPQAQASTGDEVNAAIATQIARTGHTEGDSYTLTIALNSSPFSSVAGNTDVLLLSSEDTDLELRILRNDSAPKWGYIGAGTGTTLQKADTNTIAPTTVTNITQAGSTVATWDLTESDISSFSGAWLNRSLTESGDSYDVGGVSAIFAEGSTVSVAYDGTDTTLTYTIAANKPGAGTPYQYVINLKGIELDANTLTFGNGGLNYNLSSLTFTSSHVAEGFVWGGDSTHHAWGDSVWTKGTETGQAFVNSSDAAFTNNESSATVDITSEVFARNVTVGGQAYTFNLNGGSLTAESVAVEEGASLAIGGTGAVVVNGSVSVANGCSLTVGAENSLMVGDSASALALMKNAAVTNNGTFVIDADVSIGTAADSSTMGGTLCIKGHTLSLGTNDSQTASIASFSAIKLDGGTIRFQNRNGALNNLGVEANKTGVINSIDMGAAGQYKLELKGTTTVNGTLTFQNQWNAQFSIENLAGSGTLNIKGNNGSESSTEDAAYMIAGNGFTGTVAITNSRAIVTLADGASLGTVNVGPGSLKVEADTAATVGTLFVNDNKAATITVNGTLNVTGKFHTWSCGNATTVTGAAGGKMNVGTMDVSNGGTNIALSTIELTVNGAATAGDSNRNNNATRIDMSSGAVLNLKGAVSFNTSDTKYCDINVNNATLNVGGETSTTNVFRNIAVNENGGTISFLNGTNTVASLTEAALAEGATTAVSVAAGASLTVNGGTLQSAMSSAGAVVLNGMDVSALTETAGTANSHFGTDGAVTTSGNYYLGTTASYVTVVELSGEGTATGSNLTWNEQTWEMANGIITTQAANVDYATYYMTDESEVTLSSLKDSTTTVNMTNGTLTVDRELANVVANGGTVTIGDGGSVTEKLEVDANTTVNGKVDAEKVGIAAQTTATMSDGLVTDTITFAKEGGVKVTNTNEVGLITYSADNTAAKVEADSLVAKSADEVTVGNQLAVKSITNEGSGSLVVNGTVGDGLATLAATSGDITLQKVEDVLAVTDLSIGENNTVSIYKGETSQTEATVQVTGNLTSAAGSDLYANLVIGDGATLNLTEALTLHSQITVDGTFTVDGMVAQGIDTLAEGNTLTFIDGSSLTYAENYNGQDAANYLTNVQAGQYEMVANGTTFGIKKVGDVPTPEPTTGTLSLLALAGLMARRRRK